MGVCAYTVGARHMSAMQLFSRLTHATPRLPHISSMTLVLYSSFQVAKTQIAVPHLLDDLQPLHPPSFALLDIIIKKETPYTDVCVIKIHTKIPDLVVYTQFHARPRKLLSLARQFSCSIRQSTLNLPPIFLVNTHTQLIYFFSTEDFRVSGRVIKQERKTADGKLLSTTKQCE